MHPPRRARWSSVPPAAVLPSVLLLLLELASAQQLLAKNESETERGAAYVVMDKTGGVQKLSGKPQPLAIFVIGFFFYAVVNIFTAGPGRQVRATGCCCWCCCCWCCWCC